MEYYRFRMPDLDAVPKRDYLLAALSGLLLALTYPRPGLSFLAWIALVPLFLAMGSKSPGKAFRLGCVCGLVAYGTIIYWINIAVTTYGHLPWPVSILLYGILTGYMASYLGVIAWCTRRGETRGLSPLILFPLLWTGLEYVRTFLFSGFPWAGLGHSQYRFLPLIQIADITGVYGVSFLIALANVVAYRLLRSLVRHERTGGPIWGVLVLALLVAATLVYGHQRLAHSQGGTILRVALVQGNIDQGIKWDPVNRERTLAVYERLSRQAAAKGTDLVVWPESAVPFYLQDGGPLAARVTGLAVELRSQIVTGSPAYEQSGGEVRYLNSAFLVSPSGQLAGRSDKIHLVPFGEYVPLARFLPFVHKLVAGIGDFSPGARVAPLPTSGAPVGVLVCFEGIFPELARAYVQAGSRVLVNITNDAWYGLSSAPYQHLSMGVFRAVENRVPLLRAANTGITAIIDSTGAIRSETPLFREAYLTGSVPSGEGNSIYTRCGDLFASICLGLAGLAMLPALFAGQRRTRLSDTIYEGGGIGKRKKNRRKN